MIRPLRILCAFFALAASALHAQSDLQLPPLFQDHMVVQRDLPIRVWGRAPADIEVEVTLGEARATGRCDADGRFELDLPPQPAGGPHEITVQAGESTRTLSDVLVGEVWIASGQSNMEWTMQRLPDCKEAIANSADGELRLFTVERARSLEPSEQCVGSWAASAPEVSRSFSAVAWHFGRHLRQQYGVPVGMIASSWGGTRAEAWTRPTAMQGDPKLQPILGTWKLVAERYPKAKEAHDRAMAQWREASAKAKDAGQKTPQRPRGPLAPDDRQAPGALFHGMISPLVPFTVRGVIWYQGESNAGRAEQYATLFPTMIRDWRDAFGQGDLSFLFVQLANWDRGRTWPELREAQRKTLELRNTGMAVAIDIGDAADIHPQRKDEVARRLFLAARRAAYGERDVVWSGPTLDHARIESERIRLHFDHRGEQLSARDGELRGFQIAGADRKFVTASARIEDDTVLVYSSEVRDPVAVRYGWHANPDCNLQNSAGLPASPFRTDHWPFETQGKYKPF